MSKNVETLETELQEINDRLQTVQRKIDDTGKQFSDNTPLTNIKKAISTVKNDIKAIDIRIGVVSNTLLQLKLKERTKVIEDGKALEILDNEYEIEMWSRPKQVIATDRPKAHIAAFWYLLKSAQDAYTKIILYC